MRMGASCGQAGLTLQQAGAHFRSEPQGFICERWSGLTPPPCPGSSKRLVEGIALGEGKTASGVCTHLRKPLPRFSKIPSWASLPRYQAPHPTCHSFLAGRATKPCSGQQNEGDQVLERGVGLPRL